MPRFRKLHNHRLNDRIQSYVNLIEAVATHPGFAKTRLGSLSGLGEAVNHYGDFLVSNGLLKETPRGRRVTFALSSKSLEWVRLAKVVLAAVPYATWEETQVQKLKVTV